jgi:hypothetical protein
LLSEAVRGSIHKATKILKQQLEISNRFAASENSVESLGINSAWESIRDNIKTSSKENLGYYRLKHTKPQFDDECSKLIDRWKQLNYNGCKIQAKSMEIICKIQDMNKKREYLKDKRA